MFRPVVRIGSAISECAVHNTRFPHKRLDQLSDRHTCRNRVRVDNNIRANSVLRKWHILLRDNQTDRAFLTTTRAEFVADRRKTFLANTHFCKTKPGFTFGHKRFIYKAELPLLRHNRCISHLATFVLYTHRTKPDYNFFIIHFGVFADKTVLI